MEKEIIICESKFVSCKDIVQLRREGYDTLMIKDMFMAQRDSLKNTIK